VSSLPAAMAGMLRAVCPYTYAQMGELELVQNGECTGSSIIMPRGTRSESLATSLKRSVVAGEVGEVKGLLHRRADPNSVYDHGLTALHLAALHNQLEVVRALIAAGGDATAQTTDETAITPVGLAQMEGFTEVVDALCVDPPDLNPLRKRFLGPCIITTITVTFVVVGFILGDSGLRWEGWVESAMDEDTSTAKLLAVVTSFTCLALLALVNVLDPGTVFAREVEYVNRLRQLGEDKLVVLDDERFAVLLDDKGSVSEPYRWCRSCSIWRPHSASHCSICKRCFWRFDHHCKAVGNCVAAGNHRFFALMLLCGASALAIGLHAVFRLFLAHGAFASSDLWLPVRAQQWPLYLAALFLFLGGFCCTALLAFGSFHTSALLFNYNTKMCLRPKSGKPKLGFNSREDFRRLCCDPPRFRPLGSTSSSLLPATSPYTSGSDSSEEFDS